jgi:hypothetical protein
MDLKELNYYYNKFKFGEDNFHNLMKRRVNEILLVSTFYDAFIFEQDGRLSEQIFGEYMQLNLSTAPRITSVPTGLQAIELLKTKKFDLVITMMRIGTVSPFKLSKLIKKEYPDLPILLLLNVQNDVCLIDKNNDDMSQIDNVFVWNGDSKIFLTMVKYIEDVWNVENDTEVGLVRVVLLVEDSIHYYSMFHPLLYGEIMQQTQRLISEELNDINKRQRMRARPKVLLVHSFEDALELYEKYKEYIIAIISDIRYDFQGKQHPQAGIKLIKHLKMHNVDCPILLQSAEEENEAIAKELNVHFLHKNSKMLLHDLRKFILNNLGFGDFVFRDKEGNEITRVNSIQEFHEKLQTVPAESIVYHSIKNNFSAWLTAHGEFLFAKRIRNFKVEDFPTTEALRDYLVSVFNEVNYTRNRGKILQFNPEFMNVEEGIVRLTDGSLGGKGRGIAFLNALIVSMELEKRFPDIKIKIPQTFIIGTSEYDYYIEHNNIGDWLTMKTDKEIQEHFLLGQLSEKLRDRLRWLLAGVHYPIAVRSSGLLEDSQSQPFAGIYETFMLPNSNPNDEIRFEHLCNAIKLVFSSVFLRNARNYIESINYKIEEEKMAVIIQEVVGRKFGDYFYPHFSGVGQSYNFYPTSYLKNSDGVVSLAVGLGMAVVGGDNIFRFCPAYPKMDIISQEELMGNSQKEFYAINLKIESFKVIDGEETTLVKLKIKEGEKHGSLNHILSVWDFENNRIVANLSLRGPRIVTFDNILKYNYFPLAKITEAILEIGEKAMGVPVEIEFAVELTKDLKSNIFPTFYVLQIRPLTINVEEIYINSEDLKMDELFLYTERGMGNGVLSNLTDIIYLDPSKFDRTQTVEMQKEISYLNEKMKAQNRQYILIGPGRWGSRDRFLGIPVKWHDINKAKIIVEAGIQDFSVDASQGTHFFHNLVSMNVGYFTVPFDSPNDFLDWKWLGEQEVVEKLTYFNHIELDHEAVVKMDGRRGVSFIYK